jgi:hypothetical protein
MESPKWNNCSTLKYWTCPHIAVSFSFGHNSQKKICSPPIFLWGGGTIVGTYTYTFFFIIYKQKILHTLFSWGGRGFVGVGGCFLSLRANSNRVFHYRISHAFTGWFLGVEIQTLAMEYQRGAYFVMLYFLTLLFCELPIYCLPS